MTRASVQSRSGPSRFRCVDKVSELTERKNDLSRAHPNVPDSTGAATYSALGSPRGSGAAVLEEHRISAPDPALEDACLVRFSDVSPDV
jgi:hypothetical protein